jgi:hypothetical protein
MAQDFNYSEPFTNYGLFTSEIFHFNIFHSVTETMESKTMMEEEGVLLFKEM